MYNLSVDRQNKKDRVDIEMFKERMSQLMDKEMDRKSFLMHVAAAFVAVFGASTLFKVLSGDVNQKSSQPSTSSRGYGYGGSPYGR